MGFHAPSTASRAALVLLAALLLAGPAVTAALTGSASHPKRRAFAINPKYAELYRIVARKVTS